jgi:probable F420-dependent oxidoreductase
MRIGAKLPNSGPLPLRVGIPAMARTLERAGFDSLWVSDHIVLPETIGSRYPFAADGRATWATDTPYLDALVALALAAAATERVRLGTAVLVAPLRNPVELAKQAASIDVASGGRLELGVGAGWLEEEFAALNVPFEGRGGRLVEWMGLARACWTGRPPAHASDRYTLPEGVLCLPTPAHSIPLLVGGHSPVALRRAGRVGDGWLAQQSALELDPAELAASIAQVAEAAGGPPRVVLRVVDSLERADLVAARLDELRDAGVGEVIVDVPVEGDDPARALEVLRSAVAA